MIRIKAPGRICLFGEHQDYLGFPVISVAFSKYIYLKAKSISTPKFLIELPDIQAYDEIALKNKEIEYSSVRDYLRSGYNHFIRLGAKFDKGYKIEITGDIPINAGCGSSSTLIIAWLFFLSKISKLNLKLEEIAKLGYSVEVQEFGEAGGMMDHYTASLGKLLYLKTYPKFFPIKFNINIEHLVLGNSKECKDTVDDLKKVKNNAIKTFKLLKEIMKEFNPYKTNIKEIEQYLPSFNKDFRKILIGNIINRDITQEAKILIENYIQRKIKIQKTYLDFYQKLGILLNKHHHQLAVNIGVSTPKLEKMIKIALENGALGAKINGSGFGGCMFALAPENQREIKTSLMNISNKIYSINTSEGVGFY
jgi:galactokinase